ncbi:MAG: ArsR family transcriptional regulator [Chloroflexota bacterium]
MSSAVVLTDLPEFLKLVAHDIRWKMLVALGQSDMRVSELVDLLGEKMNLLSYHLKKLRDADLVYMRRSDADGRDVYYSLNLPYLQTQFEETSALLNLKELPLPKANNEGAETRVLFVCTHNAARSQLAEGIMRYKAQQKDISIQVFSAGSQPTAVHPEAIRTLTSMGIDASSHRATSMLEYENDAFDYVITVCDIAREVCPDFRGGEVRLHWGFADPAKITDSTERGEAFEDIASRLESRIEHFLNSL